MSLAYNPYTYTNGFKSDSFHHVVLSISGTIHTLYLEVYRLLKIFPVVIFLSILRK